MTGWKSVIADRGGDLRKLSFWGKRSLAFDVKKFHQGNFILMHIQGASEIVDELERLFKINEEVIRFQTVVMNPQQLKVSENILARMENPDAVDEESDSDDADPKKAAPDDAESKKAAPDDAEPKKAAPDDAEPKKAAPDDAVPDKTTTAEAKKPVEQKETPVVDPVPAVETSAETQTSEEPAEDPKE